MALLCVLCAGCEALYQWLDKEGAEEKEIVGEVIPYEINPTVEEIQRLLKLYGYNPGEIDGQLGLRTRNAIEKFQKDIGLSASRFADKETWAKLNRFQRNNLLKDYDLNITLIQQLLKKAGCDPGKIDGKRGPRTNEAIKEFQAQAGIKVDGKVGFQTLTQLAEYLSETAESEAPF